MIIALIIIIYILGGAFSVGVDIGMSPSKLSPSYLELTIVFLFWPLAWPLALGAGLFYRGDK